jgi:transcriptional regulator with XRE-family HTH domain
MYSNLKPMSDRLRSLRAEKGFSQQCIAAEIGISQKTYSRWENNAGSLSSCRLKQICDALEVDIYQVIGDNPNLVSELQRLQETFTRLEKSIHQLASTSSPSSMR